MKSSQAQIVSVFLAAAVYMTETSAFPVVLQVMSRDELFLTENTTVLAWAFSVAAVFGIVTGSVLGKWWGPIAIFNVGILLYLASAALIVVSSSFNIALATRFLGGFGAGIFSPLIPAILHSSSDTSRFSLLSLWAIVTGIVGSTVPFIASVLLTVLPWRFFFAFIFFILSIALILSITSGEIEKERQADGVGRLGIGSLLTAQMVAIMVYIFIIYGCITWLVYFIPNRLDALGQPGYVIGAAGAAPWISFTFACYVIGKNRRFSANSFLSLGLLLAIIAIYLVSSDATNQPHWLIFASVIAGASMASANIPTTSVAFYLSDKKLHGIVSGLDILAARVGGAVFLAAVSIPFFNGPFLIVIATIAIVAIRALPVVHQN